MWRATPGYVFTDGSVHLDVRGDKPVTIISVTSLGGAPSLKFLGSEAAYPRRTYTDVTRYDGWPPRRGCDPHGHEERCLQASRVAPTAGLVVTPTATNWHHMPFELLLGYRIVSRRYAVRTGIRVVYKSGGVVYQAVWHPKIVICPPWRDEDKCLADVPL